MSKELTLESGHKLTMAMATFGESRALFQAVSRCFKALKIDGEKELNITENLSTIKDTFIECITDKDVEAALLPCLKRCAYDNKTISGWELFDDEKIREDYLSVVWEVSKYNLSPFTKSLYSEFLKLTSRQQAIQK
jgi:hypothetical protein